MSRRTRVVTTHGYAGYVGGCRCEICKAGHRGYQTARREWLQAFKNNPCTDCGGRFPTVCMQWDHLPENTKEFTIGSAGTKSKQRLLDEMAKCELVCANCHAIRTHNRRTNK